MSVAVEQHRARLAAILRCNDILPIFLGRCKPPDVFFNLSGGSF